jgi:hypothetical protein
MNVLKWALQGNNLERNRKITLCKTPRVDATVKVNIF